MNRTHFIKSTILGGLALGILPQLSFADFSNGISNEELIGKGQPQLFGKNYKLREEAHEAFMRMASEAKKSNIHIQVVSSYRSYEHQNRIWERKYKSNANNGMTPENNIKKIIEYSTIPGTSRHHWGSDLDIIDANVAQPSSVLQPRHFEENGCYRTLKVWMDQHANSFGFYLVYTDVDSRKGFNYEPWHYSYKPLAQSYLKAYRDHDLLNTIQSDAITGSTHFSKTFINAYLQEHILDINPALL